MSHLQVYLKRREHQSVQKLACGPVLFPLVQGYDGIWLVGAPDNVCDSADKGRVLGIFEKDRFSAKFFCIGKFQGFFRQMDHGHDLIAGGGGNLSYFQVSTLSMSANQPTTNT